MKRLIAALALAGAVVVPAAAHGRHHRSPDGPENAAVAELELVPRSGSTTSCCVSRNVKAGVQSYLRLTTDSTAALTQAPRLESRDS